MKDLYAKHLLRIASNRSRGPPTIGTGDSSYAEVQKVKANSPA